MERHLIFCCRTLWVIAAISALLSVVTNEIFHRISFATLSLICSVLSIRVFLLLGLWNGGFSKSSSKPWRLSDITDGNYRYTDGGENELTTRFRLD